MTSVGVRRVGEHSLLVDCPDLASVLTLRDALRTDPLPGQVEVVAAAATVLVRFVSPPAAAAATTLLGSQVRHRAVPPEGSSPSTATVGLPAPAGVARARRTAPTSIEVVYDGPDLAEVAGLRGLSVEAVVAEHTDQTWTGAFGGFVPGFVYLTGRGADVPRRSTPRTVVPAGAVGVAGGFSAVYPTRSPGGWHLIGLAQAVMWDPDRDPAALVAPGGSVRFVAVRPRVVAGSSALDRPPAAPRADPPATPTVTEGSSWVVVVEPGPLSLVEDMGRPGLAEVGVSPSGAADRGAARRANRLVGNPAGAAVVETLGGLVLRARGALVVAVTGAPGLLDVGPPQAPAMVLDADAPVAVPDGALLRVGAPSSGLRRYVAVRGGIDAVPVLGSRSTDVLSGIGPAPLQPGAVIPVGPAPAAAVAAWPDPGPEPSTPGLTVRVVPGPRDDWFDDGLTSLSTQGWLVSARSNRVGLRLEGVPLVRARTHELPSEGMVAGAIQVPPSGLPVVLLADHPVTGGYPVVAVVLAADLDVLAQAAPGAVVRFEVVHDAALPG